MIVLVPVIAIAGDARDIGGAVAADSTDRTGDACHISGCC